MIAALGNLQIRIVARGELHPAFGDQIDERFMARRQMLVHRGENLFVALRSGDREHPWMAVEDALRLRAQAARDDHAAILGERLADRVERLIDRGIDETAGIDDHEVGGGVSRGHLIALGAQPREDALGVHERLGATQAHEAHLRNLGIDGFQGNR